MNKKFIWLIISCLMVAALLLASCAEPVVEKKEVKGVVTEPEKKVEEVVVEEEKSKYGGTITSVSTFDIDSYDIITYRGKTLNVSSFTHDTLLTCDWWDRKGNDYTDMWLGMDPKFWIGSLAESWEQTDPLTVIFHLRKGVHWHMKPPAMGREFVAEDVKAHFERLRTAPAWQANPVAMFIDHIETPDKHTVTFKLKEAYVPFVAEVGVRRPSYIYSRDQWETYGDCEDWTKQIGTGPFILTDVTEGASRIYERNPTWWKKDPDGNQLPYVDRVKMLVIKDRATMVAALRTAKLDLNLQRGGDALVDWMLRESLEKSNPELQWKEVATASIMVMYFREDLEELPFDDVRVRQALSMVTDMQEVVDVVFGGRGIAFGGPAKESWEGVYTPANELPEDVKPLIVFSEDNIEKAKALLTEAGYPNGFKTEVSYKTVGAEFLEEVMPLVQYQWSRIGVDLKLVPVDDGTARAHKNPPFHYPECHVTGGPVDSPEAVYEMQFLCNGRQNRGHVCNPDRDNVWLKACQTIDRDERYEALRPVYLELVREAHTLWFPRRYYNMAWWPWVKGYQGEQAMRGGYAVHEVFAYIWLDQELRKEMIGR